MSAWNNESDFCLAVDYDLPEYDAAYTSKTRSLLIAALIISLLAHAIILVFKPHSVLHVSPITSSKSVDIHLTSFQTMLNQKIPEENNLVDVPVDVPSIIKPIPTNPPQSENKVVIAESADQVKFTSKPIEWLSAEDYKNISEENKKFDTEDALAFNPGLKESRNKTRRVSRSPENSSLETWKDGHGNQFYKTGDSCFMSLPQTNNASNRDGVNWYRVSCGGGSGGGDMLDNVNREMRERFKNP